MQSTEEVIHGTEEVIHAPEEVIHAPEEVIHGTEEVSSVPSILSVDNWKHTKAFTNNKRRETQTQYYVRMNAAPDVVDLVSLDSKPFGSVSESIMAELFQMAPRTSTQHDGVFEGHKCEIKCARYWAGNDECRWQHMEPEHDYDFAMLALLDFHAWKVWCITKAQLMGELREKRWSHSRASKAGGPRNRPLCRTSRRFTGWSACASSSAYFPSEKKCVHDAR